jgi:hypothetical protein
VVLANADGGGEDDMFIAVYPQSVIDRTEMLFDHPGKLLVSK